jgi:glycosyltransferase involved in cell wall biosynthesis
MKILFLHQNFPAQFTHLAPKLNRMGHEVVAMSISNKSKSGEWNGVKIISEKVTGRTTPGVHPWVADFETKTIRGEACFRAGMKLKEEGYAPEKIIAHHGWGESLFIKEVWPEAKLGIYCEFFYHARGADVGFDPEFLSEDIAEPCRIAHKNLNNLAHFPHANAGLSPTYWQASTFPDPFSGKITVIHDGIDTNIVRPDSSAYVNLNNGTILTKKDEIVTFINRNLEPYRGYHIFMRALPRMLKDRPNARFILIGEDGVSYGAKPNKDKYGDRTWKQIFIDEVKDQISENDWARVHFVGKVPYGIFLRLMQISSVHVYLTYPFVLSWSLLEAMSAGCAIVASDTQPVREAISDNETGLLVNFFDYEGLARNVDILLDSPSLRDKLGKNARRFAIENYDLNTVCLPRQIEWVNNL